MQVVALIQEQNGNYSVSFPDFPGCTTAVNDSVAVIVKAAEALSRHIARMIADGRKLPQVRSLSRLADDPVFLANSAGLMIALVPYTPAPREVRLEITFDETLLARVDRAAEAAGETCSGYLADAARQRLAADAMKRGDTTIPVVPPRSDAAEASKIERSISEPARSTDTAESLACIRETLERLDAGSVKPDCHPMSKSASVTANPRLILKPSR